MAATVSLCFSLDPQPHHLRRRSHPVFRSTTLIIPHQAPFPSSILEHPLLSFAKSGRYCLPFSSSTSDDSSSYSSTSPPTLHDPFRTGRFLTNEELQKLQFLANFSYCQELKSGLLYVQVMKAEEMDMVVSLLSESFGDSMLLPNGYVTLLGFLMKQYLIERRTLLPHTATLVGFYRESEGEDLQLAGTLEVCFDRRGANNSTPSPTPPKDSPYVCNMTVTKPLRRRGIGWHLLKASEELIYRMSSSREVYLHCRIIDEAPFNMYAKAGYSIVKTDSILILLTLQRRKHLMRKELQALDSPSDSFDLKQELPSPADTHKSELPSPADVHKSESS